MKNFNSIRIAAAIAVAAFVLPTAGMASFHTGSGETTDGFVCPVFNDKASIEGHNPNAVQLPGGDFTIIGPDVSVPTTATNDDGAGSPGGDHTSPGDDTYTAVWSG